MNKTKLEIIEETGAYYSNPENRATKGGECLYLTSDGRMCAVGRCMKNPKRSFFGTVKDLRDLETCEYLKLEEELKPEYQGHEMSFWYDLQCFHDNKGNFNRNGISEIGRKFLNRIKEHHSEE